MNKEQKIIQHHWNQKGNIIEWDPDKNLVILKAIYAECVLQKHNIDQDKQLYDSKDAVEYHYEKWTAFINNQNNFVDLAFSIRDLLDEMIKKEKDTKWWNLLQNEDRVKNTQIKDHLKTLLTRCSHGLGWDHNKLLSNLKTKSKDDIKTLLVSEKKKLRGKCCYELTKTERGEN